MAALPALPLQIAVITGTAVAATSVVLARMGRLLNPAWVIVSMLYLIGPIGGIFSQADSDASALGVVILALSPFVIAALVVRRQTRARLLLLTPVALLLVLAGASLAWSPARSYGFEKLFLWGLTGFVPATFILVLGTGSRRVSWTLIVAAALTTSVVSIAVPEPGYPPTLFGANPIWASRAAFLGALVALFGPFPSGIKLVTVPVMVAAGLVPVSLGPLLGLATGAVAGIAEALRCSDRADRRVALGWAALGAGVGLTLIIVFAGLADPILAGVLDDPNVEARAGYLTALGPLFLDAPLIGAGIGGFAAVSVAEYPHNLVAEIAAELGFAGLLLLLFWFGLALRGAARSPVLVALVVATGVFSLFSGNVASNSEFWMCTALAVTMSPIRRQQTGLDRRS